MLIELIYSELYLQHRTNIQLSDAESNNKYSNRCVPFCVKSIYVLYTYSLFQIISHFKNLGESNFFKFDQIYIAK